MDHGLLRASGSMFNMEPSVNECKAAQAARLSILGPSVVLRARL